jgi:hypothetical protein
MNGTGSPVRRVSSNTAASSPRASSFCVLCQCGLGLEQAFAGDHALLSQSRLLLDESLGKIQFRGGLQHGKLKRLQLHAHHSSQFLSGGHFLTWPDQDLVYKDAKGGENNA